MKMVRWELLNQIMIIAEHKRKSSFVAVRELWSARELLRTLVWKDLKVRYKETFIGIAWVVLQPIITMMIFTAIMSRMAGISSDGIPYPLFAYSALIVWEIFSRGLVGGSVSITSNGALVKKIYFPRLILPVAALASAFVDFLVSLVILVIMLFYFGRIPGPSVSLAPVFVLGVFVTALGISFWLSALQTMYRDVAQIVPFLSRVGFFLVPIIYPSSMVPQTWRSLYALNPMVGMIEGFRWSVTGSAHAPDLSVIAISTASGLLLCLTGFRYFINQQARFTDYL